MVKRSRNSCSVTGSSMRCSIMALSLCLMHSLMSCFRSEKSCAPLRSSSSTFSTALLKATYALYSRSICEGVSEGSMRSDRRMTTMMSISSLRASSRMANLTASSSLVNLLSFSTNTGSPIFSASASIDLWKFLIPSCSVREKIRCINDRAPNGWAKKRSRTFDMTAAGLATLMTFFIIVYGIRE